MKQAIALVSTEIENVKVTQDALCLMLTYRREKGSKGGKKGSKGGKKGPVKCSVCEDMHAVLL